ncbi:hypothetical protein TNCV_121131 [Trichonephila clavipes]|nr:hypothetical protein TNCV_121131 [Trichonephila clavipes]
MLNSSYYISLLRTRGPRITGMKEVYPHCQSDKSIDRPSDGVQGTKTELISVASAYCPKEPMELGRRRCAHRYVRQSDYWGRERGLPGCLKCRLER